jgi:hypothetical protein
MMITDILLDGLQKVFFELSVPGHSSFRRNSQQLLKRLNRFFG